jgi:hypothetical protein
VVSSLFSIPSQNGNSWLCLALIGNTLKDSREGHNITKGIQFSLLLISSKVEQSKSLLPVVYFALTLLVSGNSAATNTDCSCVSLQPDPKLDFAWVKF